MFSNGRSEFLYDERFQILFRDAEVRTLHENKFQRLAKSPIDVASRLLEWFTVSKIDSPFPFPHSDSSMYWNVLYVGGTEGVEFARFYEENVNTPGIKLTDIPALGVATGSSRLAVAGGSDGVHQANIYPDSGKQFSKVLNQHSTLVRWMQICLFSSSAFAGGYFADFVTRRRRRDEPKDLPKDRDLRELLPASKMRAGAVEDRSALLEGGLAASRKVKGLLGSG